MVSIYNQAKLLKMEGISEMRALESAVLLVAQTTSGDSNNKDDMKVSDIK
jgi:hypothetical protein